MPVGLHSGRVWRNSIFLLFPSLGDIYVELLLRFLWWDGSTDEHPEEYAMTLHIFGATDPPCVANLMLKRTADEENHFDPTTLETLRRNFYVDDVLQAVSTSEAVIKLSKQLRLL